MAYNVKFLKGTLAAYQALVDAKTVDLNTFYYTEDEANGNAPDLYLGTEKLTNADDIAAAVSRIELNENAIKDVYFIPDEPFFFRNANGKDMEKYLNTVYKGFDTKVFYDYLDKFDLDKNRKISTFSKGMQKQMAIICGLCANTKYLICDETFDGLDPVMRQGIKGIFANHMEERGLTPIIASHNLRELEDICDTVGLLHKGGVILSKDLLEMKCNIQKIQCVFATEEEENKALQKLSVLQKEKRGMLCTMTARGSREEIVSVFDTLDTFH